MKKLIIAVLLLAATAGGVWWQRTADADVERRWTTAPVEKGTVENAISALGTVKPFEFVDVGTQVSGQIKKIHVQPGDTVAEGDLLAEIDPLVYEARVEADRANLQGLRAQLIEREASLDLARQRHQRQAELMKSNATSREEFESSKAAVTIAEAQIQALKAELARATSTLEGNEANLNYTRILAPMAGTVMSLSARQGQTLSATQQAPTILQIADLQTMTVWTQVSEADVGKLRIGMDAYFTTLGYGQRTWSGTLRQILPTPEVVNNVVLYNALFEVTNAERLLMPEMTAQVFFVVEKAEDVLLVPIAALRERGGAARVEVMGPNGPEERAVETGVRNRVSVEIVSGLDEGEQVVVGQEPAARRRPGTS